MKHFLYCLAEEGGMDTFTLSRSDDGEPDPIANRILLDNLRGWMSRGCEDDDVKLMAFMADAEVGEFFHHRLGVCIRITGEWI